MEQYAGLIERLEKAEGPSRELDCRIAAAIGWVGVEKDGQIICWHDERGMPRGDVPYYTENVDHTLALVDSEWNYFIIVERTIGATKTGALVGPNAPEFALGEHELKSTEPRPALALLTAIMKARAALTARPQGKGEG